MSGEPKDETEKGLDSEFEDEPSAGTIAASPELEEALREAADAVQGRPVTAGEEPPGDEGGEEPGDQEPVGEGGEIEELRAEVSASRDRLLRLQADFENFRRRALAERHDIYRYGHENLVKDLLPTVDNLERAIGHAHESDGGGLESFLQGVELVRRELLAVLEQHSVREIEALGKAFDPALHEAMMQAPDATVAPNTVLEVLQKGYLLRDRLLRPSRVVVAKAPEGDTGDGGEATD